MNFSFLNPLFLIGLTALALPFIAHLISRKSGLKKRFPAVRFLVASSGDTAVKSRLKDLILLLLRSLIIVITVLVFSRPALFSFVPEGDESPRSLAIVIDNSFSMGYGDNFERAKERAKEILDTLPDGSFGLVAPLVPDSPEGLSPSPDLRELRGRVSAVTLSSTFTDNEERMGEVLSAVEKTADRPAEAVLITDLQKNGWNGETPGGGRIRIIDISGDSMPSNTAVSDASSTCGVSSCTLSVKVSNFSGTAAEGILARIRLGDEEIKGFYDIGPGDSEIREFTVPEDRLRGLENPGGSAVITPDKLEIDDTRYFVPSGPGDFNVLIVDGDPREDGRLSETYYLAGAAETVSELTGEAVSVRDNDSFLKDDLSGYDLIFLANAGEITPRVARRLEDFTAAGGILVIFPGGRTRSGPYNTLLKNLLPGELMQTVEGRFSITPEDSGMFPGEIIDKISQIKVRRYFEIIPGDGSDVIFSTSGGSPFLIGKDTGRGRVFLFASTADTSWNDFPITPVFLPVVKEFLDMPGYSSAKKRNFTVGDRVPVAVPAGTGRVEVINPGGEKFAVTRDNPLFEKTYVPGIYTVTEGGGGAYKFSVNVDPRESSLEKISIGEGASGDTRSLGLVKVFREIWRYFLLGAIALFISESVARAVFS